MASLDASAPLSALDVEAAIDRMQSYFLHQSDYLGGAVNFLAAAAADSKLGLKRADALTLIALRHERRFDAQLEGLCAWMRERDGPTRCRAWTTWLDRRNQEHVDNETRQAELKAAAARREQEQRQEEEAKRRRLEVRQETSLSPAPPRRPEARSSAELTRVFVMHPEALKACANGIKQQILDDNLLDIYYAAGLISVDEERDFNRALERFLQWTRGSVQALAVADRWLKANGL